MNKNIKNYTSLTYPGSLTGLKTFYKSINDKTYDKENLKDELLRVEAYARHRPFKSIFERNKVIVPGIDHTWQLDLLDVRNISSSNFGYKFILTVIDVFSKYGWARGIKRKSAKTVLEAFKDIVEKSGRRPKYCHTDAGLEFRNKYFKEYLCTFDEDIKIEKDVEIKDDDDEEKKEVDENPPEAEKEEEMEHLDNKEKCLSKWFKTNTKIKAGVVERFNRTLRERLWRYFTNNSVLGKRVDQKRWFTKDGSLLQTFVDNYNNTYHSSIKNKPINISKANEEITFYNLYGFHRSEGPEDIVEPKFKVGDVVRVALKKYLFEKGYTANWSKELYTIDKVILRIPVVYKIRLNLNDELRQGVFYENELQLYQKA